MKFDNFFSELKRRNVLRAAAFYAASAWLLVQVATQVFPFFQIAEWLVRWIIVAAAIGFPFWVLFAWFYQWTPQGLQREQAAGPLQPAERQSRRNVDRWIMAMLAIAVVLLLTDKFVLRERASQITAIPEKSIAVLPMINSTDDPANEYFSDGMSEEFISSLGRLHELKVIGRTSSFQFKGKTDDSKTIGEKLGVHYLLEGSVRRSADRVRIAVVLITSGDGVSIWSETYDREMKDIFAVQSEIAGAVAKELKVALLGNNGQAAQLATAGTPSNQNVEAYDALLQGIFYYGRRTAELAPQNASVMANLALLLADLGRLEESAALGQRALALDPLRNATQINLASALIALGRYDQADAVLRKAIEEQPQSGQSHTLLAQIAILRGKPGAAVELAKQETDSFWRTYGLALAQFANGDRSEADAVLKKLIDEDAGDAGVQIADFYALRKDPEKMFEWLEHAWTTHDSGVTELLFNLYFVRTYKEDPRFIAFAQKVGVMPKAATHL